MSKAGVLKWLGLAMGYACAAIGIVHVVTGIATVPGETTAGATVDSRERFYNAIFFGYGLAWIWVVRQRPIPARAVRWLAAIFLLSGVGRVLSVAVHGWPHWFQIPLAALELGLPPLFFWLADADERERNGDADEDAKATADG